jgi:hypothetical protein
MGLTKPGYIVYIYGNVTMKSPVQQLCTSKSIKKKQCKKEFCGCVILKKNENNNYSWDPKVLYKMRKLFGSYVLL